MGGLGVARGLGIMGGLGLVGGLRRVSGSLEVVVGGLGGGSGLVEG